VTVLTSHDRASLQKIGLDEELKVAVRRLARLAQEAGLDGVVCSPQEIDAVRANAARILVSPHGIRPPSAVMGDQNETHIRARR
jgi:orotidine-5'-phosphate decarboxylase